MGNLRFSKVWHITFSQSVADVGGQTWSPFSVSYLPFRAVTLLCSWRGFDSVGKSLVTRWFHMHILHAQISLLKMGLKHWAILYSVSCLACGKTTWGDFSHRIPIWTLNISYRISEWTPWFPWAVILSVFTFLQWLHFPRVEQTLFSSNRGTTVWLILFVAFPSIPQGYVYGIRDFQNDFLTNEELVIESCGVTTVETLGSHIIVMSLVLDIIGQISISVF